MKTYTVEFSVTSESSVDIKANSAQEAVNILKANKNLVVDFVRGEDGCVVDEEWE